MYYRGYRITFVGYDQDGGAVFLITRRYSSEVLAKTSRVCEAIEVIQEWEKQIPLQIKKEASHGD